jgi:purine nucleoside phosphorylase
MTSKRRRDQLLRRPKEPSSARKKPPISSRLRRPSGLGSHFFWGLPLSIANQMTDATTVRYETIPHFPRADRSSHAGRLVIGKLADVSLGVLCGRVHYYEGLGLNAVVFPIRMLARMGFARS